MNSFFELTRTTSPFQENELYFSQSTKPLFDIGEIIMTVERSQSTSSLIEELRNIEELKNAFIHGGKDEKIYTVVLGSDAVAESSRIAAEFASPPQMIVPSYINSNSVINVQQCCNCLSKQTTLWRRIEGDLMCNACALYYKLHGRKRPKELLKSEIKRRRRKHVGNK